MAEDQGQGKGTVYDRIFHQIEVMEGRTRDESRTTATDLATIKTELKEARNDINVLFGYRREELEAQKRKAEALEDENKRLRERPLGDTRALKKEKIKSNALVWVQLISTIGAIAMAVIALLSR